MTTVADKLDNRMENLRSCTHQENLWNNRPHRRNKTGIKGVFFNRDRDKFQASIYFNGHAKFLGSFLNKEQAGIAYKNEANKLRSI